MINWAIIGTGGVATDFSKQFCDKNAKLYAVCSRDRAKAQKFANKFKMETYFDDYNQLLSDKNIDIVYIASPHNTHYKYIKKALEANKHVLCEKVIVLNSKQLKIVREIAKEKELFLAEAMTIHYMPLYENIKVNDLGPLKVIQVNFGSYKNYDEKYFFKKELAGGALFDIGVYALNIVRFFMSSKPTEIKTMVNLHESGVDESSGIILRNHEGEIATVTLAFRAKLPKRVVIAYERGYIEIDDYPQANRAKLVKYNGEINEIKVGNSDCRFMYESSKVTELLTKGMKNQYLEYTVDVLEIMDKLRDEWNLKYDDEEI